VSVINDFRFDYRFLSNFHMKPVVLDGIYYPSNENAYQAYKTLNLNERQEFTKITPMEAKKLGKKVKLRSDWEGIKFKVMLDLNRKKFSDGVEREGLLATGDTYLIEGNWWHDGTWGHCYGQEFKDDPKDYVNQFCEKCEGKLGQNLLGKILMQVRQEIVSDTVTETIYQVQSYSEHHKEWNQFLSDDSSNLNAVIGWYEHAKSVHTEQKLRVAEIQITTKSVKL
jgi:ribA/ribD-fused uncharacterized protein